MLLADFCRWRRDLDVALASIGEAMSLAVETIGFLGDPPADLAMIIADHRRLYPRPRFMERSE
jgi:hypothetical protein